MISSEALSEQFGAKLRRTSTHATLLHRGTYQPSSNSSAGAPTATPSPSPATVSTHAPTTPHKVTRIVSRKLPPPPHYSPPATITARSPIDAVTDNLDESPKFVVTQDTIPRSLAFKFMRWMRLGQDVIHIEEDEEALALLTAKADAQKAPAQPDDMPDATASTESMARMLDTSTIEADGEIEHAALREAAASEHDIPLEEVMAETKSRWRSFGRRAVAKSVLPLLEYSAAAALKTFKNKPSIDPIIDTNAGSAPQDYDPEIIEATVDSLLEDVKKSRRISKKSMLHRHAQGDTNKAAVDNDKRYIDNIQTLYGVGRGKAAEMIRTAIAAAKSDPKGPKIVELHDNDGEEAVFGVKIRVEGGPAISFAPSDIHARLSRYITRS